VAVRVILTNFAIAGTNAIVIAPGEPAPSDTVVHADPFLERSVLYARGYIAPVTGGAIAGGV